MKEKTNSHGENSLKGSIVSSPVTHLEKALKEIIKGCEHDGSYIPVDEVIRLMKEIHKKALDDVENIVHDIIIKYNSEYLGDDNFEEDWIHAPKILKEIKELRG